MVEITSLEYLLVADAENALGSTANLKILVPDVLTGIEGFVAAFDALAKAWEGVTGHDEAAKVANAWIEGQGMGGKAGFHMLRDATLLGPDPDEDETRAAQKQLHRTIAILVRAHLTNRIRRDFLFGLSDLFRLRVSGAHGYLRLQCETVAQLVLMRGRPGVAPDWLNALDHQEGRLFYKARHRRIKQIIRALGLHHTYDQASNEALHSRPGGISRGLLIGGKTRLPGEVRLAYQEIDDPRLLLFELLPYLRFHLGLLELLDKLYPEIAPEALAAIPRDECRQFLDRAGEKAVQHRKQMGKRGVLLALGGNEALGE